MAALICGCGAAHEPRTTAPLPPDYVPLRAGRGPAYKLPAVGRSVAARRPVLGLRCRRARPRPYGVHLELYARRLVLPVPAGIGIAPPQHRRGAYVLGGACAYPLRTIEPTGLVLADPGRAYTLGQLFALWGQPLGERRLAGFREPVLAFVGGRRWRGGVSQIPLAVHAQIVLEVGGYVRPHREYRFPPGL